MSKPPKKRRCYEKTPMQAEVPTNEVKRDTPSTSEVKNKPQTVMVCLAQDFDSNSKKFTRQLSLHCKGKCKSCRDKIQEYMENNTTNCDDDALKYCLGM